MSALINLIINFDKSARNIIGTTTIIFINIDVPLALGKNAPSPATKV